MWTSVSSPYRIDCSMTQLFLPPFLVLCLLVSLLTALSMQFLFRVAPRWNLIKTNYTGLQLPDLGAAIWVAAVAGYTVMIRVEPARRPVWEAFALVAFTTGLLGFIDDRFGNHRARGFRGHFGRLRKGEFTTGAAKAILIPSAAIGTAMVALNQPLGEALVTAATVSLLANSFNMLDMRPGRAATGWLLLVCVLAPVALLLHSNILPLILIAGPVLVYFPMDIRLRGMMGDTGANLLGALLGLQIAVLTGVWTQAAIITILLLLQIYGEEHRQVANIIDSPWLKWLDIFTRKQDEP